MTVPSPENVARLARVFDRLDYERLATIYCDSGGTEFWQAHREPALRQGLCWAEALAARLKTGRSIYVGAGVAELPALVTEVCELKRKVHVFNLHREECDVLNSCLRDVGVIGIEFECKDAMECEIEPDVDHLSLVSVFTDPENYPTVSGVAYGRIPPVLLDVARFEEERSRLRRLAAHLLGCVRTPAWVTTTVEEVPWLLDAAQDRGLQLEGDDEMIDAAIVGDPIGFLRVTRRADASRE